MIQTGYVDLANYIIRQNPKISIKNDLGQTCIDIARNIVTTLNPSSRQVFSFSSLLRSTSSDVLAHADGNMMDSHLLQTYRKLIQDMESRLLKEKEEEKTMIEIRSEANSQHRQRQQVLAANARSYNTAVTQRDARMNNELIQRGLGQLQDHGWGFFPSLTALQFHGSIPEPPPSLMEMEHKQLARLERIWKSIGILILIYFIFM